MENTRVLVGERIRALRKDRGWSQEELGEKADLHHTYVGAIERGEKNASIDTPDKIADALGVVIADLLAFVQRRMDVGELRARAIAGVKDLSPGTLEPIAALIETMRDKRASVPRKRRSPGKKEVWRVPRRRP